MKKILLIIVLVILTFTSFAQSNPWDERIGKNKEQIKILLKPDFNEKITLVGDTINSIDTLVTWTQYNVNGAKIEEYYFGINGLCRKIVCVLDLSEQEVNECLNYLNENFKPNGENCWILPTSLINSLVFLDILSIDETSFVFTYSLRDVKK